MLSSKNKKLVSMSIWSLFLGGLVLVAYFLFFSGYPFGMRPGYEAQNHDVRLTQEAKTASPLISSLERFYAEHHRYPYNQVELIPYLPTSILGIISSDFDQLYGWIYEPVNIGVGCRMTRKLGWDPILKCQFDGKKMSWIFDLGDGSP